MKQQWDVNDIIEQFALLPPEVNFLGSNVVTELSRLGRSTGEVISLINELVAGDIRVVVIKQGLTLDKQQNDMQAKIMTTLLSLFAELERDLISLRTREPLAAKKAQGISLGKPKGAVQESICDKDRERIVELLQYGVSARRISEQHLMYGHPSSLNYYIQTRQLREEAEKRNGDKHSVE